MTDVVIAPERTAMLNAIADAHSAWVGRKLKSADAAFDASRFRKPGSDYNQHHVDLDADGAAEDEFASAAAAILQGGRAAVKAAARPVVAHLPGEHNQQSHGNDGVSNALDKLKLGKKAPAGVTVRSSRKIKTDYADVGIAEVDTPAGPQLRVGVITAESGRWGAGFGSEDRKAQLRKEIAEKQERWDAFAEGESDEDDEFETNFLGLQEELEELEGQRTTELAPAAVEGFRRQLAEAINVAKANKAKQDDIVRQLDALDAQSEAIIDEFSDSDLEKQISDASRFIPGKRRTIKGLEDGPNPPRWSAETVAELLEMHKADLARYEAQLAPLLRRRAEIMPQDARIRLEDIERRVQELHAEDVDDILAEGEVAGINGSRLSFVVWGSDDDDADWVTTRLYVLKPGEDSGDADNHEEYAYFRGLRSLAKLAEGLKTSEVAAAAPVVAHLPGQHDQSTHGRRGPKPEVPKAPRKSPATKAEPPAKAAPAKKAPAKRAQRKDGGTTSGAPENAAASEWAARIASGVKSRRVLSKDYNSSHVELVTFKDGSKAVYKTGKHTGADVRLEHDAEELGAKVATALGLRAPGVHRISQNEAYFEYVDTGTLAITKFKKEVPKAVERLAETPSGIRMGLLDVLIENIDRNSGNWFVSDDDEVIPIDHGLAWAAARPATGKASDPSRPSDPNEPFLSRFATKERFEKPLWAGNGLSRTYVESLRPKLMSLRPEFERLGHADWHDRLMTRLDVVSRHADGKVAHDSANGVG